MGGEKSVFDYFGVNEEGITPAWAGKSIILRERHLRTQDHPRVGGEKIAVQKNGTRKRGSPPRGRGKVTHYNEWLYNAGITPAWAGKSTWSPSFKDLRQDHPRVGGEKSTSLVEIEYY